ncbi:MAG: aspartate--tRNA ligase [Candidatus Paceibacterota bacterium]|jgi:aspartyl-tRNA synthetase
MKRTLNSETPKNIGGTVKLSGWVNTVRSHGKIIFIDLRDFSGIVQVVFTPKNGEIYQIAQKLRPEWVISIEGEVKERPQGMINDKVETGKIEVEAKDLRVISEAKTLPFPIDEDGYQIGEQLRMKYRYLDLRRERMKRNITVRQKVISRMRNFLQERNFVEVETPMLTKSTPEGARDFLVPSRLEPGNFYALPQSPQQYKQMLQIAGFERYFQIARCLRDEDPRADRQAEHTQLDIEMSFAEKEEIMDLIEELYTSLVKSIFPEKKITQSPFPRITYKEAMDGYGTDKPDLRKDKNDPNEMAFAFVVDFPMFEWHEEEKKWGAMHHPFTKPQTEDASEIKKSPETVLAHQYDFVLNGYEIGGGSLRTTDLKILLAVFEVLGHKKEDVKKRFGHYFEAFSYGVPPHGGIAPGIDRFLAVALNEESIREVIAFPKTGDNRDLMMDSPSEVSEKQLSELHLKIVKKKK